VWTDSFFFPAWRRGKRKRRIKTMSIVIDQEFRKFIPPLTDEEFAQLEANILAEGCRDALVLWGDILVDGHNRYDICTRHEIRFDTVQYEFEDRSQVKEWIIRNQFGRRNLLPYVRTKLALELESVIAARAKANQVANLKQGDTIPVCQNSDKREPIDTKREVAAIAGVSHDTVMKVKKLEAVAAPEVKAKLATGEISINQAHQEIKKAEKAVVREKIKAANAAQVKQSESAPTVHCGDSLAWIQTLDMQDLMLTDPPYSTDVEDIGSFVEWLPQAWEKVKPTGRAYVFIGAYPHEIRAYLNVCERHNINVEQILTWTYKNTMGPKPKRKYFLNYQAVLYIVGDEAPDLDCDMLVELCAAQEANHPARSVDREYMWQKPDSLVEQYIRHSTRHGDKVFDPFCGSGTTMLAAAKLGRVGQGCEIQRDVADIAVKRGCVEI
jgi:hypothetical protein